MERIKKKRRKFHTPILHTYQSRHVGETHNSFLQCLSLETYDQKPIEMAGTWNGTVDEPHAAAAAVGAAAVVVRLIEEVASDVCWVARPAAVEVGV